MDDLRCFCGEFIVKSYPDRHKTKVRSSILLVGDDGVVRAVCRKCGLEHEVPLVVDLDLSKSLQEKAKENRSFLRKRFAESKSPDIVVRKNHKKTV